MKEIYFDNAATTRPSEAAVAAITKALTEAYANPSSLHRAGYAAEKLREEARSSVRRLLGVSKGTIYFTSGGTEGNNTVVFGAAALPAVKHMTAPRFICSAGEHPSCADAYTRLAEEGFDVQRAPLLPNGRVDIDKLADLVTPETVLVSVMHVNNETGAVNDLAAISAAIKAKAPKALFHSDGVQGMGKLFPITRLEAAGVDLYTASSHKINGPKGSGVLWLRDGVRLRSLLCGGGQEDAFRSGTENMPGICGFGAAAEERYKNMEDAYARLTAVHDALLNGVREALPDTVVISPADGAPHILNLAFPKLRAEVTLHALESAGIYVGVGSACSSHKRGISPTLAAMGIDRATAESAVRFSFSPENTVEEANDAVKALVDAVAKYGGFKRR